MNISKLKFPSLFVAAGLVIGFISDLLLYDKPMGISLPIVIVVLLVGLAVLSIVEKATVTWVNLWLVIPLLFLSAMSAVRAAPISRFLNISGSLLLLVLLADRYAAFPLPRLNLGGYVSSVVQSSILSAVMAVPVLRRSVVEIQAGEEGGKPLRRVVIGVLIAAPFLCVFTILFAAADMLFETFLEDILGDLTLADIIGHGFLTALLAWVAIGGLAYALTRKQDVAEASKGEAGKDEGISGIPFSLRNVLGSLEASIVLFSVDVLFLIFVGIQAAALFGGARFVESQGLTYAEYARQGFFELLAVALITLALILALDFATRRETKGQRLSFLVGSGLMVGLTIIILVSAFGRLQLYELAFGFTRLRLLTHVFMIWLAALMAFFFVLLVVRRPRLFATGVLVFAIGYTTTLNVLNPDRFIMDHNLARYARGEELDVDYLGSLSADIVPQLVALYEDRVSLRDEVGPWLRNHLVRLDGRRANAGWPSTHVSMNRAYRLLDKNREVIETYEAAYRYSYD